MVVKFDKCLEHSGLENSIRDLRSEFRVLRAKINRMEKLLWALTMAVGAGTVSEIVSPGATEKVVSMLIGGP